MAIDSATKRFSILDFGDSVGGIPCPPDGSFDQSDKQTLLSGYSGILWGAAAAFCKMFLAISGANSMILIAGANPAIAITGSKSTITIEEVC